MNFESFFNQSVDAETFMIVLGGMLPNRDNHFYFNGQGEENSTVRFVIADCTHLEREFEIDTEYSTQKEQSITFHFIPFGRKNLALNNDREKLLSKIGTLMTLVLIYEKAVENNVDYLLVNTRFEKLHNFIVNNLGYNLITNTDESEYLNYKKSIVEISYKIVNVKLEISGLCSKNKITEKEIKAVFCIK